MKRFGSSSEAVSHVLLRSSCISHTSGALSRTVVARSSNRSSSSMARLYPDLPLAMSSNSGTPPTPRTDKNRAWSPSRGISFSTAKPQSPAAMKVSGDNPDSSSVSATNIPDKDHARATHDDDPSANIEPEAEIEELPVEHAAASIHDNPPISPLEFKMLDSLFYAAKTAPIGSPQSFWSYDMYRRIGDDGVAQKPKVHYCTSRHTMERVLRTYFMDEKVLGFDLEWVYPTNSKSVKDNVSLIQLASPSRIGLFHTALFSSADLKDMSPAFREIMESSDVTKVGVNIGGDTRRVQTFLGIESRGVFELSHIYRLVTFSRSGEYKQINKKLVSLATQVQDYLHLPLFKGNDVRSGNWSKALNSAQVAYSASDAYAGLQLYATLQHHREQLDPCPPNPHHSELKLPIRLAEGIEIDVDDEGVTVDTTRAKKKTSTAKAKEYRDLVLESLDAQDLQPTEGVQRKSTKAQGPKDSRVEAAEDRAKVYISSNPNSPAKMSSLRAYFLWHKHYLEPAFIAKLLRDPPLQINTVNSYILGAIQAAELPYNSERLSDEIVGSVPSSSLWRYPFVKKSSANLEAGETQEPLDVAKTQEPLKSMPQAQEWEFEPMPPITAKREI